MAFTPNQGGVRNTCEGWLLFTFNIRPFGRLSNNVDVLCSSSPSIWSFRWIDEKLNDHPLPSPKHSKPFNFVLFWLIGQLINFFLFYVILDNMFFVIVFGFQIYIAGYLLLHQSFMHCYSLSFYAIFWVDNFIFHALNPLISYISLDNIRYVFYMVHITVWIWIVWVVSVFSLYLAIQLCVMGMARNILSLWLDSNSNC